MKVGISILIIVAALLMLRSYLIAQDEPGADAKELEMLKEAWKRHKKEKLEENPGDGNSESRGPLEKLEGLMKGIERGLSREDPGQATQEKQREALELLDELIKQLTPPERDPSGDSKKEPKPDSGGADKKPGRLIDPSRSDRPAEPGAKAKSEALKKARKKDKPLAYGPSGKSPGWDPDLPGRLKLEDLEPGMDEKRPPKYRRLIERYFRKLLEGLSGR